MYTGTTCSNTILNTAVHLTCTCTCIKLHQGRIKRRGGSTPDTLPIDIEILDVSKHSTSGCSREDTFTSVGEYSYSAMFYQSAASASSTSSRPTASPSWPMIDMAKVPMDTTARSFTTVRCCSSFAAAEALVMQSVVHHHRCTALYTACTGRCIVYCMCQIS